MQSTFYGQSAVIGPPANAVHDLETVLDLEYSFKWRNKHITNSTNTAGSRAACLAAGEVEVQNSVS